jgi:N6-adenosine-specific RNA methylase IME4
MNKYTQFMVDTTEIMKRANAAFEKSGLTLDELGSRMGIEGSTARNSAWQFLNRTTDPRLSMLLKFSAALGIPVEELLKMGNKNGQSEIHKRRIAMTNEFTGLVGRYGTILIDPPWRFANRTVKMAPEHKRLRRYETMSFEDIGLLPVALHAMPQSHLYMWCPNALILEGLQIMKGWGFTYKTNIVWYKTRKDGGPDGRGVGFYFRNVTEMLLFGTRGKLRTLKPGRTQVNIIVSRKEEHSKKPEQAYEIIEACSPGPYLELFARQRRTGWEWWGDQAETYEESRPSIPMYNGHVANGKRKNKKDVSNGLLFQEVES